jgi:hypothetical protein
MTDPAQIVAETEAAWLQPEVDAWMDACFGNAIKSDQLERADRFTEEALELAQTMPGFWARGEIPIPGPAAVAVELMFERAQWVEIERLR